MDSLAGAIFSRADYIMNSIGSGGFPHIDRTILITGASDNQCTYEEALVYKEAVP